MKYKQYLLFAITGAIYLWYINALPYGIFFGAGHDDGWFIRRAIDILNGDWFGLYNQMTLIKGSVYPFFLALTSVLGVSLQFSTAFFHLIAAYLVIYSLSEYLKSFLSKYTVLILLLISQFSLQRVVRDEISLVLLLLIFSLTVIVFFNERVAYKNKLSALLGVLIGLLMLTREDGGLTVIPIVLFAVSLSLMKFSTRENLKSTLVTVSIMMFLTISVNVSYKLVNYFKYNSYVGVELLDSNFGDAVSALYSVREDSPQRYVEVSNANLNAIYQISPTFRSLASQIEKTPWRDATCIYYKPICGQIGTGYFMWALRDVMAFQGYYSTPETAKINYRKITSEIRDACETGKIKCANKYLSKIPAYELFDFKELMVIINKGIKVTFNIPDASNPTFSKDAEGSEVPAEFLNISHYFLPESKYEVFKVSGWYYDKSNSNNWFDAKISMVDISSNPPVEAANVKIVAEKSKLTDNPLHLERLSSLDVANGLHDSNATMQRFIFYAPCTESHCTLSVNKVVIGDLRGKIELKSYSAGGIFYLDEISGISKKYLNMTILSQEASSTNRYNAIAKLYNRCSEMLFSFGIISILILILLGIKKRRFDTPVLVVIVLWFMYFWRIIFLSLITFYFIPTGMNDVYLYPSIVIMPIASFMSIYILYDSYWKYLFNGSDSFYGKVACKIITN